MEGHNFLNHKSEGYTVPEGYFKSSRTVFKDLVDFDEKGQNQNEGYTVPEYYFEKSRKLIKTKAFTSKVFSIRNWAYVASSIAAVFALVLVYTSSMSNAEASDDFDSLSQEEVMAYLDNNENELSLELFADEALYEEDLEGLFDENDDAELYLNEHIEELDLDDLNDLDINLNI